MKRIFLLSIASLMLACALVSTTHAQLGTADLSISTIPLQPLPLQTVQLKVSSYGFDLSQANIVWSYNGAPVASGTGRTAISITAPGNGQVATIAVTASGNDFAATTATLLLRPASVDVLWEGVGSYTPPFYKGRSLPSTGGVIRVTAIPAINAPSGISYSWSENDSALQDSSGYGKSSVLIQNGILYPTEDIAVTAKSSLFSGAGSVTIMPRNPNVIGYFNTDGYIDYANGSASSLGTSDNGAIVHFEPYFFSTPYSISHDLSFSYTDSSGNNIQTGDSQNELRLSRPDNGGQSQLSVAISTIVYSLQNLTRRFSVNFN